MITALGAAGPLRRTAFEAAGPPLGKPPAPSESFVGQIAAGGYGGYGGYGGAGGYGGGGDDADQN